MKKILFVLFALIHSFCFAQTYTIENIPNVQLKDSRQFVSNPDRIISAQAAQVINQEIDSIRKLTTVEIAVVLINSIGDEEIKPFATKLFEHWGIGKRSKDNGLLVLFVNDKKQITFETGYGLEGVLPDAICKRIQMNYMIPYFKEGNFNQGMIDGIAQIGKVLRDEDIRGEIYAIDKGQKAMEESHFIQYLFIYIGINILVLIIMIVIITSVLSNKNYPENYDKFRALQRYKSPVLYMAVLSPITMILFAVWFFKKLKSLRNTHKPCDKCGAAMHKLNEQEDDRFLNTAQQMEERINSVDYDVWLCDKCGNKKIYRYDTAFSHYSTCPQCHAKTYGLRSDKIVRQATPFYPGMGQKEYFCQHCHYSQIQPYEIPRIIIIPPTGGGNNRGGGGGFGGGFGGGSFGGGRSGGGGATSGW